MTPSHPADTRCKTLWLTRLRALAFAVTPLAHGAQLSLTNFSGGEPVWAKFRGVVVRDCDMFQGVVEDTSATTASVSFCSHFGTERYTLRDSLDQEYVLHPPGTAVQPEIFRYPALAAPKLLNTPSFFCPSQNKPLPPPPYSGMLRICIATLDPFQERDGVSAFMPSVMGTWMHRACAHTHSRHSARTVNQSCDCIAFTPV